MYKKIFLFVLGIIISIPFIVNGEEQYSMTLKEELVDNSMISYSLYLNGMEKKQSNDSFPNYFVYFLNENDTPPVLPDEIITTDNNTVKGYHSVDADSNKVLFNADKWSVYDGYDYAYVIKETDYQIYELSERIQIKKPQIPNLSQRYSVKINEFYSHILIGKLMCNYKVIPKLSGLSDVPVKVDWEIIEDHNLLRNLANDYSRNLGFVLTYAKGRDDWDAYNLLPFKSTADIGGIPEGFYYFYVSVIDDNNEYIEYEDVTVLMAKNGVFTTELDFSDYLDKEEPKEEVKEPEENIKEGEAEEGIKKEEETKLHSVKNPETADMNWIILFISMVLTLGVFIYACRNINKTN